MGRGHFSISCLIAALPVTPVDGAAQPFVEPDVEARQEPSMEAQEAFAAGDYARAADLLRAELADCRLMLDTLKPDGCMLLAYGLVSVATTLADHATIDQVGVRYLEDATALFGPVSLDRSIAASFLSASYTARGRFAEAEAVNAIDLEVTRALVGENHPDYGITLNNMGVTLDLQGRYSEAEPLYRDALRIQRDATGPETLDTATALGNLARNLDNQGRLLESEDLYREALAIRRTSLQPHDPDLAINLQNLALVLRQLDLLPEALDLLAEAGRIRLAALGPDHPDSLSFELAMAGTLTAASRHRQAAELFESLLARRTDHPEWSGMNSLLVQAAEFFLSRGRAERADELLRELIAREQASEVPNRAVRGNALVRRARILRARGDHGEALRQLDLALADLRASGDRLAVNEAQIERARIERDHGDFASALATLEAVDRDLAAILPDDHPSRLFLAAERGETLAEAGNPAATAVLSDAVARAETRMRRDFASNPGDSAGKDRYARIFEAELAHLAHQPENAARALSLVQLAQQSAAARVAQRVADAQKSDDMSLRTAQRGYLVAVQTVAAAEDALVGARDESALAPLTARLLVARAELDAASEALRTARGSEAELGPVLDLATIRERLAPEDRLIVLHEERTRDRVALHRFVVTRDTLSWDVIDPDTTSALQDRLDRFRLATRRGAETSRGQVTSTRVAGDMQSLLTGIRAILEPQRPPATDGEGRLFTVANGSLSAFPLALILGESAATTRETRLPIVASLPAERPAATAERLLAIGVSTGSQDLPELPWVISQLDDLASLPWGGAALLRDREATLPAIVARAGALQPDIVVIAAHARIDAGNPQLMISDGAGGLTGMDLADISSLPLDGALIVLSACDTANLAELDDDALSSFTWAFLAAGARGVVVSHWPVDDAAGRALAGRFVEQLRLMPEAPDRALAEARDWLRQQPHARWQEPFYWSVLSYVDP